MKIAIMQPYYIPYPGYFQLMEHVDIFVVYDTIKYTKKGWINRNRIWSPTGPRTVTIPISKDSDYLNINQRSVSKEYNPQKIINIFKESYSKAPFWNQNSSTIKAIHEQKSDNLFDFLFNSIVTIHERLNLQSKLVVASSVENKKNLKGADRVINICKLLEANEYVNPIGGKNLYDNEFFKKNNLELRFLRSTFGTYPQLNDQFLSNLSVIDALMFLEFSDISNRLKNDFRIEKS